MSRVNQVIISLVVLLVIVALLVGGTVLKRRAARFGARKGMESAARKREEVSSGPDGLAVTVTLVDQPTAVGVVAPVLASRKGVKQVDGQTWNLALTGGDDVLVGVRPGPEGAVFAVLRTIEMGGGLLGVKEWAKLRAAVTASAQGQGVATGTGRAPLAASGAQVTTIAGDFPAWEPVAR